MNRDEDVQFRVAGEALGEPDGEHAADDGPTIVPMPPTIVVVTMLMVHVIERAPSGVRR